jgi:hypothetical protein
MTGVKWTPETTEKIAQVLVKQGISVSPNTVARLLDERDFSLRANRKSTASNSSPYLDQQFQLIASLHTRFERQGLPIISVDSKKREMIGNFKQPGSKWDRTPVKVNVTIYSPMPTVWLSPMGSTTRCSTAAWFPSASPMTLRHLPRIPSPLGGNEKVLGTIRMPPVCSSWPIPAAATAPLGLENSHPNPVIERLLSRRDRGPLSQQSFRMESR